MTTYYLGFIEEFKYLVEYNPYRCTTSGKIIYDRRPVTRWLQEIKLEISNDDEFIEVAGQHLGILSDFMHYCLFKDNIYQETFK